MKTQMEGANKMLEVGQIFNKDGKEFCVLNIIDFNMKKETVKKSL